MYIYKYICIYVLSGKNWDMKPKPDTHTQISLNRKHITRFSLFHAITISRLYFIYITAQRFYFQDGLCNWQRQAVNKQHCCWLIKLYNKEASPIMGGCTPHFCFVRFTLPISNFIGPRPKFDWCTRKYVSYIMLPGKILT